MGFGTLFIGYFFLINISYFSYTDIIGGMVLLMGLYRLSTVNSHFRHGMISSAVFSLFALFELSISVAELFAPIQWISSLSSYIGAVRYSLIFVVTLFILRGIEAVANEVEAETLAKSAKTSVPLSFVFLLSAAFELPFISNLFGGAVPYIYFALLLAIVVFIISNLLIIYKSYMQICMPEELNRAPKKSKFEFMNKFYDSIERRSQAYAEYKLNKQKEKNTKRKK